MHQDQQHPGPHQTAGLPPEAVAAFRNTVYRHYRENRRPMPWRETRDPYHILVSEIMLQQTQVERVRTKYGEFLERFPDVATLAAAPLSDVLAAWQGLGYNRRGVALKRAAETVMGELGGRFPTMPEELEKLPGIGHYTARAVATFACGIPVPFIETNIRTVFIHCFFPDHPEVHDRDILPLVAATLDRDDPREWYYALMDYGVMLKREHPNPGRRSAHHVRQSPFKGSNRELRSRLLKKILSFPGMGERVLIAEMAADPDQVRKNLAAMVAEGLFVLADGGYRVP
jgi:A/G-specific adenine glycosylase